jgi:O-antigen/teichoic acid export membrane protein
MEREDFDEHFDPTFEINLDTIKKRAVRGIALLTGRTLLLNIISFLAQGLLWIFISPSEFGVFLMVSAIVNFLSYFADIGLGAALIQKKERPKSADFDTVFIVQEVLVLTVVIILFALSPFIAKSRSLSHEGLMLLYALNISFFLASLKNIPSIILERRLEYGKFVIPQVLENLVYSVSIVYFAWKGFGITSFTYSVLIRGVTGLVAIYFLQPWFPRFGFSKESLKGLLKFGIPYQLNSFLATLKDDGMTIVLGGVLGSFGLGILGTAQKLAQYPLRFFMDNVNKVTFPAFSRMQDDKNDLARSLTRSIFFICALVFPSLVGLAVLFPVLVEGIPKYGKWSPAYVPLLFLSINSMWAASTTQLTNTLASIGRIKTVLKLMIMWTVLTWVLVPVFSHHWGVNGASFAFGLVGSSSFVAFLMVKKIINWSVKDSVVKPLAAALLMGVVLYFGKNLFLYNFFSVMILTLLGSFVYGGVLFLLVGDSLIGDVKKVISEFMAR